MTLPRTVELELADLAGLYGRTSETEKHLALLDMQLREATRKLAIVNFYCQEHKIGKWGESATLALIEDHKRLNGGGK